MSVNKTPKVSIIVNSFKDKARLDACLNSLSRLDYSNREIIVVTYGIRDLSYILKMRSRVDKFLVLKNDRGLPYQRNLGYRHRDPSSEYVLFVDDDVKATPLMLRGLVDVLEKYPRIAVAQPMLVTSTGAVDCCGMMVDQLGYSYYVLNGVPEDKLSIRSKYIHVSYTAGACVIFRVSDDDDPWFRPFDGSFYFNYEDVDISLRNWIKDRLIVCVPSSIAIHDRGRTSRLGLSPDRLVYLNTRNKFTTLLGIYNRGEAITYLPLFVLIELLKSVMLLGVNANHARQTVHAIDSCLRGLSKSLTRRRHLQRTRKRSLSSCGAITGFNPRLLCKSFSQHYDVGGLA